MRQATPVEVDRARLVGVDRARLALGLAKAGEAVAVVPGGDAGVFGMAAAVFEAAEDPAYSGIAIRVFPGISAVLAVAAKAGAPIGADFAVIDIQLEWSHPSTHTINRNPRWSEVRLLQDPR